jgi:hypothetical protein
MHYVFVSHGRLSVARDEGKEHSVSILYSQLVMRVIAEMYSHNASDCFKFQIIGNLQQDVFFEGLLIFPVY